MKCQLKYNAGKIHRDWVKIIPFTSDDSQKKLTIFYSVQKTPLGRFFIANTQKGVCFVGVYKSKKELLLELSHRFPNAVLLSKIHNKQLQFVEFFTKDWEYVKPIALHLKGTEFQLKVWSALLQIPLGKTTTYRDIAEIVGKKRAYRAVGSAVGRNPILFLIPCHRVMTITGKLGGFYWGIDVKIKLLNVETAGRNKKMVGFKNWNPTIF